MQSIPEWFRKLYYGCDSCPANREVASKWVEYQGWRQDGYSKQFALVRVGLADAEY